jgi:UDP-N-acetyl-2-amino-2-deoxyglucuronate dehydrogenase
MILLQVYKTTDCYRIILHTLKAIEGLHHGDNFEFSGGFTELHTRSYEHILEGNGFRITEAEKAIQTVYNIRHQKPLGLKGETHPLAKLPLAKHPFEANK